MSEAIENKVQCPKCGYYFPITDVILGPLRSQITTELEEQYQTRIEKERSEIERIAQNKAEEKASKDISDLNEQVQESEKELKELRDKETAFRRERRKWEEEKEQLDLKIQRGIDQFKTEYEEKNKLKVAEKDQMIEGLSKKIDELQKKIEIGSQQAQGEVLEITLEELLKQYFPEDQIVPVPKGVRGADLIQKVNGNLGTCCGTIIWESKNTRSWNKQWIDKLKENQQEEKADIAIIATAVLPENIKHFDNIDGVWVTHWPLATQVASAMRMVLTELYRSKVANQAKDQKMEILYDYLTGPQFKQRIEGIVGAFTKMRKQLAQERAAMERIWSRQEKQLQLVEKGTFGMYGDLEAIAGTSLPQIESLSLTYQLESGEED